MSSRLHLNLCGLSLLVLAGCATMKSSKKTELPENYRELSPRIHSSGEPVDRRAFAAIREKGVKTIISVDGAVPDAKAASKQGLEYVHLPMGYDGVPDATIAAIQEVMKTREGSILIHCHHGKHRGPSAAVIACMMEGSMTHGQALATLKVAGTSPDYAGLWRDVGKFAKAPEKVQAQPIVAKSVTDPLTESMVHVDHAFEALEKALAAQPPRLGAARSEAVLLKEGFRESSRHAAAAASANEQQAMLPLMQKSEQNAEALEAALGQRDLPKAQELRTRLKADCRACHVKFRN